MPDLPKNQQQPMNRIMDNPAVAHSSAWKKWAVRETDVLPWLCRFTLVDGAIADGKAKYTYVWSKSVKAILSDSDRKKPIRKDPR